MDRRKFIITSLASAGGLALAGCSPGGRDGAKGRTASNGTAPNGTAPDGTATTKGRHAADAPEVGKPWPGWKKGHFQVHFIYTGVGESAFYIFPDGTTMLLDCGDHNAIGRGKLSVPVLPHGGKHSGEWIARYVARVNPNGNDVDYMMLSHYHNDHAGGRSFYAGQETWNGEEYLFSGFSQAARTLNFGKAFDRCYPAAGDPIPLDDGMDGGCVGHMRQFYRRMEAERGMVVEKFRVGATDQVKMLRAPGKYPSFSVRNICANGRIAHKDGTIEDLYADFVARERPRGLNENGMSLGMEISYGDFRLFTAGDFSDEIKMADGSAVQTENRLAEVCNRADVAKINHHGHYSMPAGLVAALGARVYVSCVWDQLHNVRPVMQTIADRSLYPGERTVYPGIFPAERRAEDDGEPWMDIIARSCYEGSHIVLDVEPSGKRYSVTCLSAADESMTVRSTDNYPTIPK